MKKILSIFVLGILLLSGFGVGAGSIFSINENIKWEQKEIELTSRSDELDQYQTEMDFFAPVGNIFLAPEIYYITAQSFIPTKNVLTRVEILAGKNSTAVYNYTLAIRDDLLGPDLTLLSLSPDNFPTENFSWIEFDFDDLIVTPGLTYYIVSYTTDATDNWYAWGARLIDVYSNGSVWWSEDDGANWEEDTDADLTFKTYGVDNNPPLKPVIDGPTVGTYGNTYDWTFVSTDPDGDDLYYYICWGGTCVGQWYGPYSSGEVVTKGYTYQFEGIYTLICIPKDIYGAEGPNATLIVTMPRNKAINIPVLDFLQNFPNLYLIIKRLLL